MLIETKSPILSAVLVGVQTSEVTDSEQQGSLDELARLVTTLGYRVIGRLWQKRSSQRMPSVLGDGKLKELARWTGGSGVITPTFVAKKSKAALRFAQEEEEDADEYSDQNTDPGDVAAASDENSDNDTTKDTNENNSLISSAEQNEQAQVVIFDCDLSPSQLRNMESALDAQVLDRTGVIIEIFRRHARTKAARMQVEIARLKYVAPRLRESANGGDRQGGGIGAKGSGETDLEMDKRRIRDRIKELKDDLAAIGQEDGARRSRRDEELCVALVGYTNAGKSSLMRALTGSEVLVADKLFATLDTTVRPIHPETRPKILVSDTVGFIKKLPHDLVASFRSTLDEALNASLLLFVVDAADPAFRSQLTVTQTVLKEIGAGEIPHLLLLNKRDRLSPEEITVLKQEFPQAVFLSTRDRADIANLRTTLIEFFEKDMSEEDLFIPYTVQGVIGDIRATMRVVKEAYDEKGVRLVVRAHTQDLNRIKSRLSGKKIPKPKEDYDD